MKYSALSIDTILLDSVKNFQLVPVEYGLLGLSEYHHSKPCPSAVDWPNLLA